MGNTFYPYGSEGYTQHSGEPVGYPTGGGALQPEVIPETIYQPLDMSTPSNGPMYQAIDPTGVALNRIAATGGGRSGASRSGGYLLKKVESYLHQKATQLV